MCEKDNEMSRTFEHDTPIFVGCSSCSFSGPMEPYKPCADCDDGEMSGKTDRQREIDAAVAAETERCAKICASLAEQMKSSALELLNGVFYYPIGEEALECERRIRGEKC